MLNEPERDSVTALRKLVAELNVGNYKDEYGQPIVSKMPYLDALAFLQMHEVKRPRLVISR